MSEALSYSCKSLSAISYPSVSAATARGAPRSQHQCEQRGPCRRPCLTAAGSPAMQTARLQGRRGARPLRSPPPVADRGLCGGCGAGAAAPHAPERTCRICWGSEAEGLVAPCSCSGSMQYVHAGCLQQWQQQLRAQKGLAASRRCDVCQAAWATAHQLPAAPSDWRLRLRDLARSVPWPLILQVGGRAGQGGAGRGRAGGGGAAALRPSLAAPKRRTAGRRAPHSRLSLPCPTAASAPTYAGLEVWRAGGGGCAGHAGRHGRLQGRGAGACASSRACRQAGLSGCELLLAAHACVSCPPTEKQAMPPTTPPGCSGRRRHRGASSGLPSWAPMLA